jgi:hypothetical protein
MLALGSRLLLKSIPLMPLRRATNIGAALATIAVGLLVHMHGGALGSTARDVVGDALWAAMITWWVGAFFPNARPVSRYSAAYAICAAVEVSQLYHTPWLDAIRATTLGHLVLGSGFDPRDLLAYALGVAGAALLEAAVLARGRRRIERSTLA